MVPGVVPSKSIRSRIRPDSELTPRAEIDGRVLRPESKLLRMSGRAPTLLCADNAVRGVPRCRDDLAVAVAPMPIVIRRLTP